MENPQFKDFVIRETLLSRKPNPLASVAMAIATLFVVALSIVAWNDWGGAQDIMSASRETVFQGHQYWKAWTTLFVHGDAKHLLGNIFLFFVMGALLTGYFGIFLVLGAAFLMGGLTNLMVLSLMPLKTQLIGLSGVVFWMGGAWLSLYFLIDRKRNLTQRSLRAMGVALVLFMPAETFDPSVSYKSHFIGFALGIIAGLLYFAIEKKALREAEVREAVLDDDEGTAVL
ncbi:rhomboid family intramembrane serine protease [Bdellovibrio sp. HCB337]|uniref:rhomboid family intramembrane serine protease n=1 Tax=Bdellovibrio sp. HCB337 TaxID=3394358 RepID=UPI0039A68E10